MTRTLRSLLAALALGSALAGCVVIRSDSHTKYRGRHVSDTTLHQIQPGTTQEYVLALLDEPATKTDLSDGASIWKWSYTKETSSANSLIFVFRGRSSHETQRAVYVEFDEHGHVRRTWRD